ncbi:unnamed protein product, partial [marine sediment metagenome]
MTTPRSSIPTSYLALYEDILMPVVKIVTPSGVGSGVIIGTTDKHRLTQISIITAAHVVGDLSEVVIHIYDYQYGQPV